MKKLLKGKPLSLAMYQIDAFAERAFEGNPAAVVPRTSWLPDGLMQAIAAENRLSETAFFVPEGRGFRIRWFTPETEVKLCGHATLAAARVVFEELKWERKEVVFESLSGPLTATRDGKWLTLDFPSQPPERCDAPEALATGLGVRGFECLRSEDYVAVLAGEEEVLAIRPDHGALARLDRRGVIATAPAADEGRDFVVRYFAPALGIPEDPVTGSAYTQLAPYWAERLNRTRLRARQVSARGGDVFCELAGDRVLISGATVIYMRAQVVLDKATVRRCGQAGGT